MAEISSFTFTIRIERQQPVDTYSGYQKSPTTEDEKTPKKVKKSVLKKSVSFENGVKGEYEGRCGLKR
jgi:hypothetical protein